RKNNDRIWGILLREIRDQRKIFSAGGIVNRQGGTCDVKRAFADVVSAVGAARERREYVQQGPRYGFALHTNLQRCGKHVIAAASWRRESPEESTASSSDLPWSEALRTGEPRHH